jgi:redox-sensitive bicupin YhaK (pirin superfamily)
MTQVIKSNQRHHVDAGWLDARWHFSFADYYDPNNMNFGALRVYNDDVVQPGGAFDDHPHRDMEIITYVVKGQLAHRDHLGNEGVVKPGEVQVMSAGKGIIHAEFNPFAEPVRLNQIWLMPRHRGNKPRWEQKPFTREQRLNRLLPVVTATDGAAAADALTIDSDATLYVSALEAGHKLVHRPAHDKVYLFVIDGQITVDGQPLETGDQARLTGATQVEIAASADSELMLIDLA